MGPGAIDEWLARARAGEEAAFLELWRELQPRLLRYLRAANCADPDDVASETWLQVIRDLDRFRGDWDDFRRWLFTVARHRSIDAARARQRRPTVPLPDDFDRLADGQALEDRVIEAMSAQDATRLLAGLSRDQAQAVALRVIAGLDTSATASVLGRPTRRDPAGPAPGPEDTRQGPSYPGALRPGRTGPAGASARVSRPRWPARQISGRPPAATASSRPAASEREEVNQCAPT